MEAEDQDLEEDLETIESEGEGEGETGEPEEGSAEDRRIALEECLHTIATYSLELAAGKREEIGAEDIKLVFAQHDLQEIYEEAELFFNDAAEESDLGPGEEGPDEDEDDYDADREESDEDEDEE